MTTWILVVIGGVIILLGFTAFFGAPYVPSRRRFIRQAFTELYPLSKSDVLVDIGSGDGVVLRVASEMGAKAVGYELSPFFLLISKLASRRQKNIEIHLKNFWTSNLPDDTTVVYVFSVSRDIKRMAAKLHREATRLNRPLSVLTYGSGLYQEVPIKTVGAYNLYTVHPLQQNLP